MSMQVPMLKYEETFRVQEVVCHHSWSYFDHMPGEIPVIMRCADYFALYTLTEVAEAVDRASTLNLMNMDGKGRLPVDNVT